MITKQTGSRSRRLAVRAAFVATTALPALAGTAGAATLATPFVTANNGQRVACEVTNVGTSPATVEVTLRNAIGQPLLALSNTCTQPLQPQHTCSAFVGQFQQAYCTIVSSSSKVRGTASVFASDTTLLLVVPATK